MSVRAVSESTSDEYQNERLITLGACLEEN